MITLTAVLTRLPALDEHRLRLWIEQDWVRPVRRDDDWLFAEIDVARLHLLVDLQDTMEIGEPAVPVVLSLLDQLLETRRQLRRLLDALDTGTAETIARRLGS